MEICPITGKPCEKPKIYHITEIKNGTKSYSLCAKCFSIYVNEQSIEKIETPTTPNLDKIKPQINDQFIEDMMVFIKEVVQTQTQETSSKKCPKCDHSTLDIIKTGKLGCSYCYTAFKDELINVLYLTHSTPGSPEQIIHTGKKPKKYTSSLLQEDKKVKLIKLKYKMDIAVKEEDYELAAKLRDQIKEMDA
jgi:protein arginine kinase activator